MAAKCFGKSADVEVDAARTAGKRTHAEGMEGEGVQADPDSVMTQLQGQNIYQGCCTLRVEYSKVSLTFMFTRVCVCVCRSLPCVWWLISARET